jgi:hypothetical protein
MRGGVKPPTLERGIRLSTEDESEPTTDVDRTFAVMLAEIEDMATALTKQHDAALKEAERIGVELERVEGVRTAMLGKSRRNKPGPKSGVSSAAGLTKRERDAAASAERVRKIIDYAAGNGGKFTGREAADAIGIAFQGAGPVLSGMVRRGEATVADVDGVRVYTVVPS